MTTPAAQFVFVDTPGFQTAHRSRLNERMNRTVRDSLGDVDAIVVVLEAVEADRRATARCWRCCRRACRRSPRSTRSTGLPTRRACCRIWRRWQRRTRSPQWCRSAPRRARQLDAAQLRSSPAICRSAQPLFARGRTDRPRRALHRRRIRPRKDLSAARRGNSVCDDGRGRQLRARRRAAPHPCDRLRRPKPAIARFCWARAEPR